MIQGQKISGIRTLKSMYDNDCIMVQIDQQNYLMSMETVAKMVNEFEFEELKKKVHTYLVNPVLIGDTVPTDTGRELI